LEAFPEMSFGAVMVTTQWPGVMASDVEEQITIPMEEKIAEVDHILNMTSISTQSLSQIRVKFNESLSDAQYEQLHTQVQNKIQEVQELPQTSRRPRAVLIRTQDWRPVVSIALSGAVSEQNLKKSAIQIKRWLQSMDGIQKVDISGKREGRVFVNLELDKLREHRISPQEVFGVLERALPHHPGGVMNINPGGILVRTRGEFQSLSEIMDYPIRALSGGSMVRISDLGSVRFGFEQALGYRKQKGELALALNIHKETSANALDLVPQIQEKIEDLKEKLPPGLRVTYFNDSTTTILRRLGVLGGSLSLGILLVFLVLWHFLGLKNSLLALLGIPFSFLTGFVFLDWFGITINEISVFSLILVSGMVVDDAIVILENMVAHLQRGKELITAAYDGAKEVFLPVAASTCTTICAFLPMVLMTGEVGRVMVIIPITVTLILIASLVEAFFILPGHFAEFSQIENKLRAGSQSVDKTLEFWQKLELKLRGFLNRVLKKPFRSLGYGIPILIFLATLPITTGFYRIKETLFVGDVTTLWVDVECLSQLTLEETLEKVTPVEARVVDLLGDGVANLTTYVGGGLNEEYRFLRGTNLAQITVDLKEEYTRRREVREIVEDLASHLHPGDYSNIREIRVRKFQTGPPVGKPVAKRCFADTLESLQSFGEELVERIKDVPGLKNPDLSLKEGPPRIDLEVSNAAAARYGLRRDEVGLQVAMAVEGVPAGVLHWEGEEVDLNVRTIQPALKDSSNLGNIWIMQPGGDAVLLSEIAMQKPAATYVRRTRFNQQASISVFADLDDSSRATLSEVNRAVDEIITDLLKDYPEIKVQDGVGEVTETQKSLDSLKRAFFVAALLMYLILATQFNSILQPFMILLGIPFAFLGVLFGMGVYDFPFTMVTYIAMIGLAGVVVNDTIVLLDFYNRYRKTHDPMEAAVEAAVRRLRPICLTTITTILGLLPVLLGFGGSSLLWRPMAVAVCFGIFSATAVTLFLVPAMVVSVESLKRRFNFSDAKLR
jgi:multidrug efflux pump subunit AcrB